MVLIKCKNCHKEVEKRKNSVFCSVACKSAYWNKRRTDETYKETFNMGDEEIEMNDEKVGNPEPDNGIPPQFIVVNTKISNFAYELLSDKRKELVKRIESIDNEIKHQLILLKKAVNENNRDVNREMTSYLNNDEGFLSNALSLFPMFQLKIENKKKLDSIVEQYRQKIGQLIKMLNELKKDCYVIDTRLNGIDEFVTVPESVENPDYLEYVNDLNEKQKLELENKAKIEREIIEQISSLEHVEESVIEVQSEVSKNNTTRIISTQELVELEFNILQFGGVWKEFLGCPEESFYMVTHGRPGSGKSTFILQLATYLSLKFGKVLYISSEEKFSQTLKQKIQNQKAKSDKLFLAPFVSLEEILEEVKVGEFRFLIIDSLNNMRIDAQGMQTIREKYKNTGIIAIAQSTKDGKMRGSQEIIHDCDIEIVVSNGIARTQKNRFCETGREFNIFKN